MRLSRPVVSGLLTAVLLSLPCSRAIGQIADQFVVYATRSDFKHYLHRYDRKLNLVGSTYLKNLAESFSVVNPTVLNGDGTYSVVLDQLFVQNLIRMDRDGKITQVVKLSFNPIAAAIDRNGFVYILTRIPLNIPGPLFCYRPNGSLYWSNWATTQNTFTFMPQAISVTTAGDLWIGGGAPPCTPGCYSDPYLKQIDLTDGSELSSVHLPPFPGPPLSTVANHVFAGRSGVLWTISAGQFNETVGPQVTTTIVQFDAGSNGITAQSWEAPSGDIWTVAANVPPYLGASVVRMSSVDGSFQEVLDTDIILSQAPGPTGEELFLITGDKIIPLAQSLRRINLVTGVQSSIPISSDWFSFAIPFGDPTGWNWAAVVNRDGDNDGDGYKNGAETDAGSHPYDANSRPNGPKAYLWFLPGSNAVAIRLRDPDGLLDSVGGLDLATVKLLAEGYGDILPFLWPFVTSYAMSADGTAVTIEFGGVPISNDLKIRMEIQATDRTGAYGLDWQITPPGVGG